MQPKESTAAARSSTKRTAIERENATGIEPKEGEEDVAAKSRSRIYCVMYGLRCTLNDTMIQARLYRYVLGFSFHSIFWRSQTGDQPQEDLAKFYLFYKFSIDYI